VQFDRNLRIGQEMKLRLDPRHDGFQFLRFQEIRAPTAEVKLNHLPRRGGERRRHTVHFFQEEIDVTGRAGMILCDDGQATAEVAEGFAKGDVKIQRE
jgi:hypothetical protein